MTILIVFNAPELILQKVDTFAMNFGANTTSYEMFNRDL